MYKKKKKKMYVYFFVRNVHKNVRNVIYKAIYVEISLSSPVTSKWFRIEQIQVLEENQVPYLI